MKIVGQLVCGPGEADRYLKQTLDDFKRLCDDVVVVTCNATPKEKQLIKKYGFWQYEDDREWGRFQPDIKTELVRKIHGLQPDYILVLDADETMPTIDKETLYGFIQEGKEACQFYVVNLWNDEQHYKRSMAFWNVRFYKADSSRGIQFLKKPVHCGNAPPYFYTLPPKKSYVPHILLHRGLMNKEDRARKYARYELYDPNAIHKGREYYESLIAEGAAAEYNQGEVIKKLTNYCHEIK
jgi:hypothetical protein